MNKQSENIDSSFREKMFNYSVAPPKIVWKRIEHSLSQNRKKATPMLVFRIAAGLLLFAGISALIWKFTNNNPDESFDKIATQERKMDLSTNKKTIPKNIAIEQERMKTKRMQSNYNKSGVLPIPVNSNQSLVKKENVDSNNQNIIAIKNEENKNDSLNQTDINALSTIELNRSNSNGVLNDSVIQEFQKPQPISAASNDLISDLPVEDETKERKHFKWSVGGQAGPQYSDRNIKSDQATVDYFNEYESPLLAYAGGVQIQVEAANRLTIQSGVYYSKIGSEKSSVIINNNTFDNPLYVNDPELPVDAAINEPTEIVNSVGNIYSSDPQFERLFGENKGIYTPNAVSSNDVLEEGNFTVKQYFEYIEIPLILRYMVINRKIDLIIVGGISTSFMVGNSSQVTDNKDLNIKGVTNDVKTFNYSGSLGIGIEYPLSSNITFNLEPTFKYYLSPVYKGSKYIAPINKSSQVNIHTYMIGLMTGINYTF
jgi:hypothetical protein